MSKTTWKKVRGFSNYEVSTSEKVKNSKTGRILKPYGQLNLVDLREGSKRSQISTRKLVESHFGKKSKSTSSRKS